MFNYSETLYPKGMSKKEIESARREIFSKYNIGAGVRKIMSEEDILRDEELSARQMINSCLTYSENYNWYREKTDELGQYAESYLKYFSEDYIKTLYYQQKEAYETRCNVSMSDFDQHIWNYRTAKWDDD